MNKPWNQILWPQLGVVVARDTDREVSFSPLERNEFSRVLDAMKKVASCEFY